MTSAKIIAPDGYKAAPNGHTTNTYRCGEVVTGQVAEWALADGAAEEIKEAAARNTKTRTKRETKG